MFFFIFKPRMHMYLDDVIIIVLCFILQIYVWIYDPVPMSTFLIGLLMGK